MLCLTAPQPACFALLCFPPGRRHGLRLTMCSFTSSLLLYALCPGTRCRQILALLSSSQRPDITPIEITRAGRVPLSSLVTALPRRSLVPQLRPLSYPSVQRCIALFCAVLCCIALYCAALCFIVLYCAVLCFPLLMPLQSMSTLSFLLNCAPAITSHSIGLPTTVL